MVKIIWSKRAFQQFERAIKYILSEQGLAYAKIVHEKIIDCVSLLQENPHLGPLEPALLHKKSEYRFLVVWSYKVIYKVDKDYIIVSRLFHTSRNPKKLRGV